MHKPGDEHNQDLVFPEIDPDFIDSQLETTSGNSHGIYDITANRVNMMLDSPLDRFLADLESRNLAMIQIFNILERFDETSGLVAKYSNHWKKLKNVVSHKDKMSELLASSVMQNIENRPGYQQVGFDSEYLKILFFLQRKYEKLP